MSIRTPKDVAERNELRRLARAVYDRKHDQQGRSAVTAWAEVEDIVHKAVSAIAMEDIARETAARIAAADTKRSQS